MENEIDIAELIHRGGILRDIDGSTPQEVYEKVCALLDLPDGITSEQVYNALCTREEVLSTAVGNGIALPHARAPIIKEEKDQRIIVVYLKNAIEMRAPDERQVYVMFVLLTYNPQVHLKVLSSLAGLLRNTDFRKALEDHADEAALSDLIKRLA